jgi:hypothetical protein
MQDCIRAFNRFFRGISTCRSTVGTVKARLTLIKNPLAHQHGCVSHRYLFHPLLQCVLKPVAQDQKIGQQSRSLAAGDPVLGSLTKCFQAAIIGMSRLIGESGYRRGGCFFATSAGNIR